jgi:hypothetical protein
MVKFEVPDGWTKGSPLVIEKHTRSGGDLISVWTIGKPVSFVYRASDCSSKTVAYKRFYHLEEVVEFVKWWNGE